jgi:hypothetical protein
MAAFDALPPAVRQAIAFHGYGFDPKVALAALRSGEREGRVLAMIRRSDMATLRIDNRLWRNRYGVDMPHVAAGATVLVTEPLDKPAMPWRYRPMPRYAALAPKPPERPEKVPPPAVILLAGPTG